MLKYLRSACGTPFLFLRFFFTPTSSFMALYIQRIILVKWGEQLFNKFNELT